MIPTIEDILKALFAGDMEVVTAQRYIATHIAMAERRGTQSPPPSVEPQQGAEAHRLAEEAKTAWGRQDPTRLWNAIDALADLAAPQAARLPLTDEQIRGGWGHQSAIDACLEANDGSARRGLLRQLEVFSEGARFAESFHGIGPATQEAPHG